MEDRTLIEMFMNRNEEALTETKNKYGNYLRTVIKNILFNDEDTEECENDVYFAIWNSIPPNVPDELKCYIAKIARRKAIDIYRHRYALKRTGDNTMLSIEELDECLPLSQENIAGIPEKNVEEKELTETINRFIYNLKKDDRIMFVRKYWFMDEIKFIAKNWGYSESKVKNSLMRTRNKLKEYLKEEEIFV